MRQALPAGEPVFGALSPQLADLVVRIAAAADVATLAHLAPAIREIGIGLVAADAGPGLATRVMADLNGRLGARVLAVVAQGHRLPAASWCWLAFGSEGRFESTFLTDQDNGLVFSAAGVAETQAMRQLFQPFAHAANEALDACGIPRCSGDIMAGNPAWCLSVEEWCQHFSGWIRMPTPAALLNATIFFDFRGTSGDAALADELRRHMLGLTAANDAFIRMMAANALTVAPPLGLLGDLVEDVDTAGGIDLKKQCARLFVDAARIFALAAGSPAVATVERLRAAARMHTMTAAEAEAAVQAFEQIQHLRLRRQAGALAVGLPADNRVARDSLNEFEHRVLKASVKQARRLQQQMKIVFRVEA